MAHMQHATFRQGDKRLWAHLLAQAPAQRCSAWRSKIGIRRPGKNGRHPQGMVSLGPCRRLMGWAAVPPDKRWAADAIRWRKRRGAHTEGTSQIQATKCAPPSTD